jgi:hypothetical protein
LLAEIDDLQRSADAALRAHGLRGASYAATVTAGVTTADPGGQAGAVPGVATHGVTTGFVRVDAETRPLDLGLGWTAAIGTVAGYQPVLAMVMPDLGGAEPIAKRGTTIATELRFAKSSRVAELAAVAGVGATRIDLAPVTVRDGGSTRVYRAAANDIDEWALRFDARFELRWYDRDVWVHRLAMTTLDPLLRASVGIRHDERFHRTGDLQPFNDPTGRVFFGISLRPVRARVISAGGAFEFEGALRGDHRLPSIYRASIDTVVDLRRVFRGRPR